MANLDLFKGREPHKIKIEVEGEEKEFKIPVEYTGEEAERILEHQVEIDKIAKEEIDEDAPTEKRNEKTKQYWNAIYKQLSILFQRYHPEMDVNQLKSILTYEDALKIIQFHAKNRFIDNEDEAGGKKKQPKKD